MRSTSWSVAVSVSLFDLSCLLNSLHRRQFGVRAGHSFRSRTRVRAPAASPPFVISVPPNRHNEKRFLTELAFPSNRGTLGRLFASCGGRDECDAFPILCGAQKLVQCSKRPILWLQPISIDIGSQEMSDPRPSRHNHPLGVHARVGNTGRRRIGRSAFGLRGLWSEPGRAQRQSIYSRWLPRRLASRRCAARMHAGSVRL